ncbi:MAG: hypothetical protein AAF328_04010 [Planctomycetota bacterium]
MLCPQTQLAAFAFAGYPVNGVVVAALNPVCTVAVAVLKAFADMLSGLRQAVTSWPNRIEILVTHASPVRPDSRPRK